VVGSLKGYRMPDIGGLVQKTVNNWAIICIILVCGLVAGCSHMPLKPTDTYVTIDLSRKYVYNHAERPVKGSDYIVTKAIKLVSYDIKGLAVIPVIALFYPVEYSLRSLPWTNVYIWPEGFPEYRQRITWGKNRVYFPQHLKGHSFRFCLEMSGVYLGTGYAYADSGEKLIELDK
jgi:hypothetical protein